MATQFDRKSFLSDGRKKKTKTPSQADSFPKWKKESPKASSEQSRLLQSLRLCVFFFVWLRQRGLQGFPKSNQTPHLFPQSKSLNFSIDEESESNSDLDRKPKQTKKTKQNKRQLKTKENKDKSKKDKSNKTIRKKVQNRKKISFQDSFSSSDEFFSFEADQKKQNWQKRKIEEENDCIKTEKPFEKEELDEEKSTNQETKEKKSANQDKKELKKEQEEQEKGQEEQEKEQEEQKEEEEEKEEKEEEKRERRKEKLREDKQTKNEKIEEISQSKSNSQEAEFSAVAEKKKRSQDYLIKLYQNINDYKLGEEEASVSRKKIKQERQEIKASPLSTSTPKNRVKREWASDSPRGRSLTRRSKESQKSFSPIPLRLSDSPRKGTFVPEEEKDRTISADHPVHLILDDKKDSVNSSPEVFE